MIQLIKNIFLLLRIYVMINIIYLLYVTKTDENHPINELTWWIYFLVFDIWLQFFIPVYKEETEENYTDEEN